MKNKFIIKVDNKKEFTFYYYTKVNPFYIRNYIFLGSIIPKNKIGYRYIDGRNFGILIRKYIK